jgi:hypothetical protein
MNAFLNSHQPSYRRENSYVNTPFLAFFTLKELLRVKGSYSRLFLRPTELRHNQGDCSQKWLKGMLLLISVLLLVYIRTSFTV